MFKVEQDGITYTFYEGDKEFSEVPGVVFSARKLASMQGHPARIKHEGKVLWHAEGYFGDLINKANAKPHSTKRVFRGVKKHTTNKRLSIKNFRVVGAE